jgi:hypothetical protein
MKEFTETNQETIIHTRELVASMCRPEKADYIGQLSNAVGRELITIATREGLTTTEILATCYCLANAMEVTVDEYERMVGN